jgi:hypothetical protein
MRNTMLLLRCSLNNWVRSSSLCEGFSALALLSMLLACSVSYGQTSVASPSIDETLAYINARTAGNVAAGGPPPSQFSLRDNGETLVEITLDHPSSSSYTERFVSVRDLKTEAVVDRGAVIIRCRIEYCAHSVFHHDGQSVQGRGNEVLAIFPADKDQIDRLLNATQHLLDLLNAQYRQRHPAPPDPFESAPPRSQ